MPETRKGYDSARAHNDRVHMSFDSAHGVVDLNDDEKETDPIMDDGSDIVGSALFDRGISPRHQESSAKGMSGEVHRDFHSQKIKEAMDEAQKSVGAQQDLHEGIRKRGAISRSEAHSTSEKKFAIEKEIRLTRERMASLSLLPWKDRKEKQELKFKLSSLEAEKNRMQLDHVAGSGYEKQVREQLHALEVELVSTSRFHFIKRMKLEKKISKQWKLVNNLAVWSAVRDTVIRK